MIFFELPFFSYCNRKYSALQELYFFFLSNKQIFNMHVGNGIKIDEFDAYDMQKIWNLLVICLYWKARSHDSSWIEGFMTNL